MFEKRNLLMGIVIILIGILLLGITSGYLSYLSGNVAMLVLLGLGFIFLIVYLVIGLKHWYWLFPAGILFATAATIWMADVNFGGEWIIAAYLLAAGLPFGVAFLAKPQRDWWALFPFSSLLLLGVVPLLGEHVMPWGVAAGFYPMVVGMNFLWVYMYHKEQWWSVIPFGALASVGTMIMMFNLGRYWSLWSLALFGGLALTFYYLWLLRAEYSTGWAKYPAKWCLIAGIAGFFLSLNFQLALAVLLILGGFYYLYLTRKKPQMKTADEE